MISGMKRNWNTFSTFWIINELLVAPYAAFMKQAKKINIPLHKLPFRFAEWNIIAVKYIKHLMKYVFFYDSYFDAREMNEEMRNIQHINKQVLCNCEMEIYKACFSCFTFFSAPEIIFFREWKHYAIYGAEGLLTNGIIFHKCIWNEIAILWFQIWCLDGGNRFEDLFKIAFVN